MKRIIWWVLALAIFLSPGCGGGSGARRSNNDLRPLPQQPQQDAAAPERNVLTATTCSLSGLGAGDEFIFTLKAQLSEETKQACGRILFDQSIAAPAAVEKGGLIPTSFIFFSKLDVPGIVPFAFTALPEGRGIAPASGELLRVRFRLIANPPPGFRVRLQNDGSFLQLRDRGGGRMSFDIESEVLP